MIFKILIRIRLTDDMFGTSCNSMVRMSDNLDDKGCNQYHNEIDEVHSGQY